MSIIQRNLVAKNFDFIKKKLKMFRNEKNMLKYNLVDEG